MKFDTTVTLGNLLQIIALMSAMFAAYYTLDKRVARVEFIVTQTSDYDSRLDALERDVLELQFRSDIDVAATQPPLHHNRSNP